MVDYKLVKEESFESISKYLNQIYSITDINNPLAFVTVNGKKYMITKVDDEEEPENSKYVICYDDGKEIKTVGSFYDADSFALNLGDFAYRRDNDGVSVIENQINGFKEQLSCDQTIETNPKTSFNYSQIDPLNRRSVYYHYIVNHFSNPDVVLPYLKDKWPDQITYIHGLFNLKKSLVLNDRYYFRYIRCNDDTIILNFLLRYYLASSVLDYYQSLGFNRGVSDEMVEFYKDKNENVKTLKKVTDEYRKNTGI